MTSTTVICITIRFSQTRT